MSAGDIIKVCERCGKTYYMQIGHVCPCENTIYYTDQTLGVGISNLDIMSKLNEILEILRQMQED